MPDLIEHMYCAQQINIPPNLPFILKQYAKAAIRTQPYDLLYWSAAYFRAKANNSPPPVKSRLEYPPVDTPSRLSPGFLKVLHKQLGENESVAVEILTEKWLGVCLVKEALESMLKIGNITGSVPWLEFVAIAAGHLCPSLGKTMVMICEVLTEEPEGGSAMIPVDVFVTLYQFLARLDCGPPAPQPSMVDTPSVTPTHSTTSLEVKVDSGDSVSHDVAGSEKDSNAGLMVWDDVKPSEKQDRAETPKYTEEPGAASELGVEVLDDAEGPVTQMVTLYPVQPPVTLLSSPSSIGRIQKVDESILSHSSLQENADWIQIDSGKPNEGATKQDEDVSATSQSRADEAGMEKEEAIIEDQDDTVDKNNEPSDSNLADQTALDDQNPAVDINSEEEASTKLTDNIEGNIESRTEMKETEQSEDSVLGLGESVTVQHFIRDDLDGSTRYYSTAEIRKGLVGDKSSEQIERTSSESLVKASETVQNMRGLKDESSEFISREKEADERTGGESLSEGETKSFIVLPEEELQQHIPGIGPVIPEAQILAVVEYMQHWASKQEGMVMPRNINHVLCPPLDLPPTDTDDE